MRLPAITLSLLGAMACGTDSGGLKATSPDGSSVAMDGAATTVTDGPVSGSDQGSTTHPTDGGGPADSTNPTTDAFVDTGGLIDSRPSNVGSDGGVATDSGAPCNQLSQCCGHIVVPPPFKVACRVAAQQFDAGDAGTCESTLALLVDAGLCP
jgi:hypothetical protein